MGKRDAAPCCHGNQKAYPHLCASSLATEGRDPAFAIRRDQLEADWVRPCWGMSGSDASGFPSGTETHEHMIPLLMAILATMELCPRVSGCGEWGGESISQDISSGEAG